MKATEYLTVTAAAQKAQVAVSTIYRWVTAGVLPLYRQRGRTLIRRRDLELALRPARAT